MDRFLDNDKFVFEIKGDTPAAYRFPKAIEKRANIASGIATLHCVKNADRKPSVIVRRFDLIVRPKIQIIRVSMDFKIYQWKRFERLELVCGPHFYRN